MMRPDPAEDLLRVAERLLAEEPDVRYAYAVLKVFARLEIGHPLSEAEIHAARAALDRVGLEWRP